MYFNRCPNSLGVVFGKLYIGLHDFNSSNRANCMERHVGEIESDKNWKFEFKQGKKNFIDESEEFLKTEP